MAPDASPPALRRRWYAEWAVDSQLARFMLLRGLAFIYVVAFLILVRQGLPLLGEHGLMPIGTFLERVRQGTESASEAFWEVPSLFWWKHSDAFFQGLAWLGLLLSAAILVGVESRIVLLVLWVVYGSFVHAGQIFYGYGWDMLLLESGFLAVFLAPAWLALRKPRPLRVPALPVLWLYRWLLFRLMFGAGLIKLRGDLCWRDLSCLVYHYETQPNPHPLSWLLHQAPPWFHSVGVLTNHFAEVIVPFGLFGPRWVRHVAGVCTVLFQVTLILSGNLSFLNWLTLVLAFACFDDGFWQRILPERLARAARDDAAAPLTHVERWMSIGIVTLVALLSLNPVANLLSPQQRMNAAFDPLHLVNTYGAFGSISRHRNEVVIEGTDDDPTGLDPVSEDALHWKEYEFPCKPGDPQRAPCWVTPYHYRLDWQMWFAGLGRAERQPWSFNLMYKLLIGDKAVLGLLETNPFPDRPPAYVRASLYRYELTHFGEAGWWHRTRIGTYVPAVSRDDPRLLDLLMALGWMR